MENYAERNGSLLEADSISRVFSQKVVRLIRQLLAACASVISFDSYRAFSAKKFAGSFILGRPKRTPRLCIAAIPSACRAFMNVRFVSAT